MTSESHRKDTDTQLKDKEPDSSMLLLHKQREEFFSGPLPPPQIISGYEDVLSGSADRILQMTEEQARHRREMETKRIDADIREALTGMRYALIISVIIIVCGTAIILIRPSLGGYISGSLLNLIGVASVVNAFLRKSDQQKDGDDENG